MHLLTAEGATLASLHQCCRASDHRYFFPSNAFMASARSLHTFIRGKQLNCSLHARLSPCRKPQKCRLWTSTQSRNCPSKGTRKQKRKPKTTQQKPKNTQPKPNPNTNNKEKWDRNQHGNQVFNSLEPHAHGEAQVDDF